MKTARQRWFLHLSLSVWLAALAPADISLEAGLESAGLTGAPTAAVGPSATAAVSNDPAVAVRLSDEDGVARLDGLVFLLRAGQPSRVDHELSLPEAPRVRTDGFVQLKNGTKVSLQDGQMITFDGRMVAAPPSVSAHD